MSFKLSVKKLWIGNHSYKMANSRFKQPNLYNTKSLKLYPDEHNHHISFRHKNLLPPNIKNHQSAGIRSSAPIKCPIYVHNYTNIEYNDGDSIPKTKYKTNKNEHKVFEKIEETYWANWKPDKNKSSTQVVRATKKNTPKIHVIKSAPDRKKKTKMQISQLPSAQIKLLPDAKKFNSKEEIIKKSNISSKCQEIQTEEKITETDKCDDLVPKEEKFLKHIDSLILNKKKQQEDVEHFEQPTCIRLYKKTAGSSSKNYVKGGTYTLKSHLKTETQSSKNPKVNRPGSPIIISSKNKNSKLRRP